MKQRKTQTLTYWQEQLNITESDIADTSTRILEEKRPLTLEEIGLTVVQHHCDEEEKQLVKIQEGRLYNPKEQYEVGEQITFAQLDYEMGTIQRVRQGTHPDYDEFSVIEVSFNNGKSNREFVTDFTYEHHLNKIQEGGASDQDGLMSPAEIYQAYQQTIDAKISQQLDNSNQFIRFQDNYFQEELLPEFQEGLLNIGDAAIDISGASLPVDELIAQMGMVAEGQEVDSLTRFIVNYQMANDSRFRDVGPAGQTLWYLHRLQPAEISTPPERLVCEPATYDISEFDDELQAILFEIDDEKSNSVNRNDIDAAASSVTVALPYHHYRSGTLPLTPKVAALFLSSPYNPVLVKFVDGQTGDTFNGWVVSEHGYVFGLEAWYAKHDIVVGTIVHLRRTDDPLQLIVDYEPMRGQRDWVRQATVNGQRLAFRMNTTSINCKYDELMMIGEANPEKIDELWEVSNSKNVTVVSILHKVFPELSKLSPQSTVHAKTLYTAVNMLRRTPPEVIFHELVQQPSFTNMEHGYWGYNPA